jgi:hypothetical protein
LQLLGELSLALASDKPNPRPRENKPRLVFGDAEKQRDEAGDRADACPTQKDSGHETWLICIHADSPSHGD